jgi:hypothetical protein
MLRLAQGAIVEHLRVDFLRGAWQHFFGECRDGCIQATAVFVDGQGARRSSAS